MPDLPANEMSVSPEEITTSNRDPQEMAAALQEWLAEQMPGADPVVSGVSKPSGNGMSSDTVMFHASWGSPDDAVDGEFVARVEPPVDDVPVFPTYDLELQHRVMALVAEHSSVPVPSPIWFEEDPSVLGSPFFVMERFPGLVPPDVLPYTFPDDNWVATSSPQQQATIQQSAIASLAAIHRIGPDDADLGFLLSPSDGFDDEGEADDGGRRALAEGDDLELLERHLAHWDRYKDWATDGSRSELLEECFDRLWADLPEDLGPVRLSWGDARIGNMLFVDHEVSGILDWELAGLAPPEIDIGWMVYLHRFFQDLTEDMGEPGLPNLFLPGDVSAQYAEASGRPVADLRWPMFYAAARHGVIMRRIGDRMIHFGERERPDDLDELIMHRRTLQQMLDGSYWSTVGL